MIQFPRLPMVVRAVTVMVMFVSIVLSRAPMAVAGSQNGASLQFVSQTNYVPGEQGSLFRLSFVVDRSSAAPVQVPSFLIVSAHRAIDSRQEVRDAVEGDLPRLIDTLRIDLTDRVDAAGGQLDVLIGTEVDTRTRELLQLPQPGLYPLTISWEENGVIVSTMTTFIERLESGTFVPSGNAGLRIALIGSLEGSITLQPNSTTVISDDDRQEIIDIVSIIETLPDLALSVAIRPELIEALDRSNAEDAELLARLQNSSALRVLSKTFVDIDPSEDSVFDDSAIFRRQLRLGEDVLSALLPTHINPRVAWFQDRQLTTGGGLLLAELGLRNIVFSLEAQQTTADGAALFADTTRKINIRSSDESSLSAALIDPYFSEALTRGSRSGDLNPSLVAQHIVTELKALLVELDQRNDSLSGRGVLLSTNDGSLPSPDMVTALFRVIAEDPRFSMIPVETLIPTMSVSLMDGRPVVVDLEPPQTIPATSTTSEIAALNATVDAFSSMLPQGDVRPRLWRRLLDVYPHRAFSDGQRSQYASVIRAETQAVAAAVIPPMATTFTLGGRDSPIRFSIRNDGDTDLRVRVRLTSSKLSLPDGEKVVLLPARSSTAIDMPVVARSNGRFPVALQMFTPEGEIPISPVATLTARVNALAGLGQLVTGIALLLLLSWWASHFRRQHRRRLTSEARQSRRHPSSSQPAGSNQATDST